MPLYSNAKPLTNGKQFLFDFPQGQSETRILILADTQIIDSSQCRYEGRLCEKEMEKWAPNKVEENLFYYLDDLVKRSKPNLIILLGDLFYGEFDDKLTSLRLLISKLDSYEIPWCPVYGNHERDNIHSVNEISSIIEKGKYVIFGKKFVLDDGTHSGGDSDYSIKITKGSQGVAVLYFLDSGPWGTSTDGNLYPSQLEFISETSKDGLPGFVFLHQPLAAFYDALANVGIKMESCPLGDIKVPGAFGAVNRHYDRNSFICQDNKAFEIFKNHNIQAVFAGHMHEMSYCIPYEGIRLCFGLKTGTYDSYEENNLGGDLLTIGGSTFDIKPLYVKKR